MTELAQHKLTVLIESTGEVWDKIQTYRLNSNYLTPSDEWEFVAYDTASPASLRRKFRPLMRVKLFIDGELQVHGRIDETEGTGGSGSALLVKGRDYVGELVDAGADPSIRFTEKQDLGDALLTLFRPHGIVTLFGNWNLTRNLLTGRIPQVGVPRNDFHTAKIEDFKVSSGQGVFETADKIVARHGYTIQPGGTRDSLCVTEPQFGQDPLYTLSRPGNVLEGRARRCYADVPSVTIATGRVKKKRKTKASNLFDRTAQVGTDGVVQDEALLPALVQFPSFGDLAPNELGTFAEVKRIALEPLTLLRQSRVDWKAKTMPYTADDDVIYRPMYYEDRNSRTDEQLERVARRELGRRMKDVLTYKCTMRGHRDLVSGAVYAIDTVATVNDQNEDVNQTMWVLDRTFFNNGQGPKTDLQLILPGAIAL
jgi:prophage tail gpP-like protein